MHTGKVKNGKIEIDTPLTEGDEVMVITDMGYLKPYKLTAQEERELDEADAEIERGKGMDAFKFLDNLRQS